MKPRSTLFVALLAIAVGSLCAAAEAPKQLTVYSPAEAAKHVGETATVEGVVSSTRELASKQVAPIAHGPVTPQALAVNDWSN